MESWLITAIHNSQFSLPSAVRLDEYFFHTFPLQNAHPLRHHEHTKCYHYCYHHYSGMLEEQIFALRKTSESRLESLKKEAVLVRTYFHNSRTWTTCVVVCHNWCQHQIVVPQSKIKWSHKALYIYQYSPNKFQEKRNQKLAFSCDPNNSISIDENSDLILKLSDTLYHKQDAFSFILDIDPSRHACSVIIYLQDQLCHIHHHLMTHYYTSFTSLYLN